MSFRLLALAVLLFAMTIPVEGWAQIVVSQSSDEGGRQSYDEALGWYEKEAKAGDPKAQFYYALALERGAQRQVDLEAARRWYERSAEGGFALAEYKMGLITQFGEAGGTVDAAASREWYRRAAESGVPEAAYNLAVLLETGQGGTADAPAAVRWFETAARAGIDEALLQLGVLFARGGDGPNGALDPDAVEALKWLLLARAAEVAQAELLVDTVSDQLSVSDREEANGRARAWAGN